MTKEIPNTVDILEGVKCRDCGWPVIDACCNFNFKDSLQWDWWKYCSNKECKNHDGEGYGPSDETEWVVFI